MPTVLPFQIPQLLILTYFFHFCAFVLRSIFFDCALLSGLLICLSFYLFIHFRYLGIKISWLHFISIGNDTYTATINAITCNDDCELPSLSRRVLARCQVFLTTLRQRAFAINAPHPLLLLIIYQDIAFVASTSPKHVYNQGIRIPRQRCFSHTLIFCIPSPMHARLMDFVAFGRLRLKEGITFQWVTT